MSPLLYIPPDRFEKRFSERINKTDSCWLWTGTKSGAYGVLGVGRRMVLVHRLAWMLAHGPIPPTDGHHGAVVMHQCDVPLCVNPAHLRLGSQRDNLADMKAKGRRKGITAVEGEAHGCAKLSESQVREIRVCGGSQRTVAARYGVTQRAIANIRNGSSWRCVA